MSALRHPFAVALLLGALTYGLAVLIAPELVRWAFVKEGPVEHASHVVLLAALVLFARAAWRNRGGARALAVAMVLYLAFLLLEEIDWGVVYGVDLGGSALQARFGVPNLHNAQPDPPTMFLSVLFWMAVPILLFAGLGLTGRLAPVAPLRAEGIALFAGMVLTVVFDSARLLELRLGDAIPQGSPESSAMGFFQTLLYGMLAAVAWRAGRKGEGHRGAD